MDGDTDVDLSDSGGTTTDTPMENSAKDTAKAEETTLNTVLQSLNEMKTILVTQNDSIRTLTEKVVQLEQANVELRNQIGSKNNESVASTSTHQNVWKTKSAQDILNEMCSSSTIKRTHSTENLPPPKKTNPGKVLKLGSKIEENSKVAVVGDSNVKCFLHERALLEWANENEIITRVLPGKMATEEVKHYRLPAKNKVEHVILHIGGNDLSKAYPRMKVESATKQTEFFNAIADNVMQVVAKYQGKTNRKIVLILPGYRQDTDPDYTQKLRDLLKTRCVGQHINFFDLPRAMQTKFPDLKYNEMIKHLTHDGTHVRFWFMKEIVGTIAENMNFNFTNIKKEASEKQEINWHQTFAGQCLRCAKEPHGKCEIQVYDKCNHCGGNDHVPNVCHSLCNRCMYCGTFGHRKPLCSMRNN